MSWIWDPDTFGVHWFNEGNDRMPAPLRYRSRFPTLEELEDHRIAVRARYSPDERRHIDLLVHTLAHCDMRIEIIGSTSKHQRGDGKTQEQYRVVGARNTHYAVVLRQTAIPDEYGNIWANLLPPEQLPTALTATIPACKPGTHRPDTFHINDLKPPTSSGYLVDNTHNTPHERFNRLARRPTDGGGQAILRLGNHHARPTRHRAMQWYDITGDGRYTEQRTQTHLDIRPTTPQALTATFTAWINQTLHQLHDAATAHRPVDKY